MWGGLVSEWQSAQLIESWDAAGSSFYGYDSQSSTRLLTNASGVVTDNYAYRAFGTEWQSGNGSWNSYRYVGQYGYDSQSSTRQLTNASGTVTDNYAYRAFGPEWQSGNGSRNSYRYVGQYGYYRDSTAMQYVRARYLDVQAGRWVSRDPLEFEGDDWNLYRYVGNVVVSRMDASGLYACQCGCKESNCQCGLSYCDKCKSKGKLPSSGQCVSTQLNTCIDKALAKYCSKCTQYGSNKKTRHEVLCEIFAESGCDPTNSYEGNYGLLQISKDIYNYYKCNLIGSWHQVQTNPCKNVECALKAMCSKAFKCDPCYHPGRKKQGWGTKCYSGSQFDCCRSCFKFEE